MDENTTTLTTADKFHAPLYFKMEYSREVDCSCGCDKTITIGPRYYSDACRQRAKRRRDKNG